MFELLSVPLAAILFAIFGDKFKNKEDDRKKIQVFFEVSGIAIRSNEKLQYPVFIEQKEDDRSTTYVYRLPVGMPSKIIQKVEDVVSEGLSKPVRIQYDNYKLNIRVFYKDVPDKWDWEVGLIKKGKWQVPMGQSLERLIYHDFDKTPHMALGGLTRMGKTVFLKNVFTSLTLAQPEHIHLYIIDLKGGLEFGSYKHLKQVDSVAEKPIEAFMVLSDILRKMEEKMQYMKARHYTNVVETDMKERYFIIVDEGAELCPDKSMKKEKQKLLGACQQMLSHIARIGGALGFRLIFCTQYPTGDTLPRQVKQNSDAKLGFRLPTQTASGVVIDESGLESIKSIPGRAIFKTDRLTEIQVPYISNEIMWNHLKQYEVEKHEDANTPENQPSNGDTCDD
ncbi:MULTISPECIES: FtsK/SpoIIIE domain-containing protein [Bacillus]|uniref:FtsK/SpoIIIE domain-containing protein n=1 Tax=Bacillus TaxID=1386 RepID=UPI00094585AB|nr:MULTISPECIES: FtsK/SpoIIIE domain-containing protein [Bacillus]PGR18737.1 cell division protein FtsK [Bacillus anthracis]MCC2400137.1 cell division protein FtsK [Bacillus paranthracis]MCU5123494.1 FtsK/SpoIIIE domain-containing protein [Bacillus paranthracis]MCU5222817.1 FtsK/SpoIIIE domain-containing protein [Bacillus tropicus]MDA1987467.1 FtsK/SpoIIIE domain-containing protein [Bacillus cereus group sp. BcHK104]